MTLLTLVENAVRHGIDPSEEGGRIDVRVALRGRPLPHRGASTPASGCSGRRSDWARACRPCASACSSPSAATRSCALDARCEPHGVCAELELPGAERRRHERRAPDRADRRRRAAAARRARAPCWREAWPELEIVAQARNGREAVELFEALQPDVCFLDVHMPGMTGVEAARAIGRRAHLVFVTAYDQYAVQAFAQGALDYLVKPVEPARLAETVARLQERLRAAQPAPTPRRCCEQLAAQPAAGDAPAPLRWMRASVGHDVRLIAGRGHRLPALGREVHADRLARRRPARRGEALIRTPLKELLAQLDAAQFAQVHRSVVVNLRAISHVDARRERDRGHPPEGPRRSAAGEPELPASLQSRVSVVTSFAHC